MKIIHSARSFLKTNIVIDVRSYANLGHNTNLRVQILTEIIQIVIGREGMIRHISLCKDTDAGNRTDAAINSPPSLNGNFVPGIGRVRIIL